MAPKIEKVTESSSLNEGPHWDVKSQSLYFVDIITKTIFKYDPATNQTTKASFETKGPSFIIPIQDQENQFLVSLDNEFVVISWDGISETTTIVKTLSSIDADKPGNKFNDGKCDSSGRVWAGTLGTAVKQASLEFSPEGSLYSFDVNRQLIKHVNNIRISNGLDFNDKAKKLYYIDSSAKTIDQFDFDVNNGTVSNRKVLFSLSKHNIPGYPDGMTIDTDGNLWVALFQGGRVLKIDGSKSEVLLETIELPTSQVTSVAFGGATLDELFVTTASSAAMQETQPGTPADTAIVYRITGTGSKGLPSNNFKL